MTTETIQFISEGIPCAGTLYRPVGDGPFPAVVLSHGFGAVRGMRNIPELGTALAESGVIALAIDYRYLGDSGGTPRQQVIPHAQRQDLVNALSYLETRKDVDAARLGLWGTSFSGGQSIQVAAFDRRVKALVVQVPATDLYRQIQFEAPSEQRDLINSTIASERPRHFAGEEPATMKLADTAENPSVFGPESLDWATRNEQEHAQFHNYVTVTSLEQAVQTAPGDYIASVSPTPLLLILAEPDKTVVTKLTRQAFERAREPKQMLVVEGLHYDAYDVPETLAKVTAAARDWFVSHLR
ncbi:alpha/beta hydrolase [Luteibacter sp. 22Crub2.1]|uniref:alpha/beta hydrolase n=1 Tax=Luteibacter sp. 22Crub2.1 TaxID=1283288 RepID=UPI0009D3B53F|nr:alpha/beta hydrolase [Luteibacter sp. 22Crub2.1]SKB30777.1 hypothetical protein SAMN05660880_00478 [Luteibacter sp. 22Crub2.1]